MNTDPSNHHMNSDEFRAWNEEMSRKYHPDDYHASASPIVRWIEKKRVDLLLKLLDVRPEHRVLEVGVGVGTILQRVQARERVGLDLSEHYLKIARERLGSSATLTQGDAEELTKYVEPASFDRIYCSEVLEHVRHPEAVLSEMRKAVKQNGHISVSVPNDHMIMVCKKVLKATGLFHLLLPRMESCSDGNEWHLHMFRPKDLKKLCAQADLEVIKLKGVPFSFLPLRYVLLARPR